MHKAAKSDKGFGFQVDNTIGRYRLKVIPSFFILIQNAMHLGTCLHALHLEKTNVYLPQKSKQIMTALMVDRFSNEPILHLYSTPQINTWTQDWIDFYAEHRLMYQLQLARDQYGDSSIYQKGFLLLPDLPLKFAVV